LARKILLADDSVTAQNMGRKILADAGYEVTTVNNGSAALKKVSEQKPDLIVLDVYMPGYSGLEVCQRLKEAGDTSRIPILLTVGKLEPFKPEEARRVRADAYIIKPFEASELLSALSKLEDKVVPRSEPSKPGRFARATAAIDERFDRSMAVEEDSGWKSRIVFPKKKEKEPEPEAQVDDPAVYNPVNKDLRTVVEHKVQEHSPAVQQETERVAEEERVNVSALGAEGLPKDVTPEEIAALAAAAAQVKSSVAELNAAGEKAAEVTSENPAVEAPTASAESREEIAAVPSEATVSAQPAPVAEELSQKPIPEAEVLPSPSEVTEAISGLEQQVAADSKESANEKAAEAAKAEVPATMAVAAAAGANGSRWAAVAVALTAEEASMSLEQEMQQATASFAVATEPERREITSVSAASVPATFSVNEAVQESAAPVVEASAVPAQVEESSVAQAPFIAEIPSSSSEATSAPVADSPAVEPWRSEQATDEPKADVISEPASVATSEPAAVAVPEISAELPTRGEEPSPAEAAKNEESVQPKAPEPEKISEPTVESSTEQDSKDQSEVEKQAAEPEVSEPVIAAAISEAVSQEAGSEKSAPDSASRIAGGTDEMAKKESETAAAWASWRKIRETGNGSERNSEEISEPKDEAAKAVAAGAESSPDEVAELDSDPEIANIVDSVLADMRPKIVQEIAKKLGKKK
jgi:CheY-like chemotaxis protein